MHPRRLTENPIIRPHMDGHMGSNINGPSLIRAPEWLPNRLGAYYLYFADHGGQYIRMAYADAVGGPYTMYEPGTLRIEQTPFPGHIASPDVHVNDEQREIRMYYHGCRAPEGPWVQATCVALSADGLNFASGSEMLGSSYFRVFHYGGWYYALVMPGEFRRSADGLSGFHPGPQLFTADFRHAAVKLDGDLLTVFYSNAGDCPERILVTTIDLRGDWLGWQAGESRTFLQSEEPWEGADQPLEPSRRGCIHEPVHQLRDPAIYREGDRTWLLYSVAGEHGIGIAEIVADV